jgi:hypothetical protein
VIQQTEDVKKDGGLYLMTGKGKGEELVIFCAGSRRQGRQSLPCFIRLGGYAGSV